MEIYPDGRLLWHRRGDDPRVWYSAPALHDADEWEAIALQTAKVWDQPGALLLDADITSTYARWLAALPEAARSAEWVRVRRVGRVALVGSDPNPTAWIFTGDPDTLPGPVDWLQDTLDLDG